MKTEQKLPMFNHTPKQGIVPMEKAFQITKMPFPNQGVHESHHSVDNLPNKSAHNTQVLMMYNTLKTEKKLTSIKPRKVSVGCTHLLTFIYTVSLVISLQCIHHLWILRGIVPLLHENLINMVSHRPLSSWIVELDHIIQLDKGLWVSKIFLR